MHVTLNRGGEEVDIEAPDGSTVRDVAGDGVVVTTANGEVVRMDSVLLDGERYMATPRSPKGGQ